MEDANSYLGHLVRRLHQQSTAVFAEEMAAHGFDVTPMQFAALRAIYDTKGIDQARLADKIACDRATLGGIVDRLESKELIRREVSPSDRRARVLASTPKGDRLLEQIEPIVSAMQERIGGALLPDERKALKLLLERALTQNKNS